LCGAIEPFSATQAQDGLVECDQPGKNPLKYFAPDYSCSTHALGHPIKPTSLAVGTVAAIM